MNSGIIHNLVELTISVVQSTCLEEAKASPMVASIIVLALALLIVHLKRNRKLRTKNSKRPRSGEKRKPPVKIIQWSMLLALVMALLVFCNARAVMRAYEGFFARGQTLRLASTSGPVVDVQVSIFRPDEPEKCGFGRRTKADGQVCYEKLADGNYQILAVRRIGTDKAEVYATTLAVYGNRQVISLDWKPKLIPALYFGADGFDSGSADLVAHQIHVLDDAIAHLGSRGGWILVFGHCDDIKDDEVNDVMGTKRCEAIIRYMLSKGVERERIRMVSFGKRDLALRGYFQAKAENRRFECIILPEGIGDMDSPW